MKRKVRVSRRRLCVESLESRLLLAVVVNTCGVRLFYTVTNTSEQGAAIAIVADLTRAPAAGETVTFTVASTNPAEGTVSTASLTFTDTNWFAAQTITVTGVDDAPPGIDDGNIVYSVAFGMTQSGDPTFDDFGIAPVILTNDDDDVQANGGVVPQSPLPEDGPSQELRITAHDSDLGTINNSWNV